MPNLDGTGPKGQGPRTGQAQGRCGKSKDANESLPRRRNIRTSRGRKLRDGSGLGKRLNRRITS